MLKHLRRKKAGQKLTFEDLVRAAASYKFTPQVRLLLHARLELVRPWIDDSRSLRALVKPGRLIVVDVRDDWLEQEHAMMLFALLTSVLVLHPDQSNPEGRCKLLLCYDEAHKFASSKAVREQMNTIVRERRHLDVNVIIASQDPLSVPEELLPLLDSIGVFRHESEEWNRKLAKANAVFAQLSTKETKVLPRGVMWFWARDWVMFDESDGSFHDRLLLIETRPRLAHHGGATRLSSAARSP